LVTLERGIVMENKYEYGQEVQVRSNAVEQFRPNHSGSICGMRQINDRIIYLVEFSDGMAVEIPEDALQVISINMKIENE
jgi:hypothetical protein